MKQQKIMTMPTKVQTNKMFTSNVNTIRNGVVSIEFPEDIVNHLKIKSGKAHWAITNGVIQVSGDEPEIEIPMLVHSEFQPRQ